MAYYVVKEQECRLWNHSLFVRVYILFYKGVTYVIIFSQRHSALADRGLPECKSECKSWCLEDACDVFSDV